jgi:protein-S-isoprenylcysteine O-methyltransferase Ste14
VISWAVLLVAVVVLALHFRNEPWPPHRIIGAAIVLVALALITVARVQLGRSFSVTAQARRLVTTGLYSRIRNPIYVCGELVFVGAAIFMLSWWPVVITLAVSPLQVKRARREAAVLEAAFGEEYIAYRRRTWF